MSLEILETIKTTLCSDTLSAIENKLHFKRFEQFQRNSHTILPTFVEFCKNIVIIKARLWYKCNACCKYAFSDTNFLQTHRKFMWKFGNSNLTATFCQIYLEMSIFYRRQKNWLWDNERVQQKENTMSNIHGERSSNLCKYFLILEKALLCYFKYTHWCLDAKLKLANFRTLRWKKCKSRWLFIYYMCFIHL